jgi:hypothetical protein
MDPTYYKTHFPLPKISHSTIATITPKTIANPQHEQLAFVSIVSPRDHPTVSSVTKKKIKARQNQAFFLRNMNANLYVNDNLVNKVVRSPPTTVKKEKLNTEMSSQGFTPKKPYHLQKTPDPVLKDRPSKSIPALTQSLSQTAIYPLINLTTMQDLTGEIDITAKIDNTRKQFKKIFQTTTRTIGKSPRTQQNDHFWNHNRPKVALKPSLRSFEADCP